MMASSRSIAGQVWLERKRSPVRGSGRFFDLAGRGSIKMIGLVSRGFLLMRVATVSRRYGMLHPAARGERTAQAEWRSNSARAASPLSPRGRHLTSAEFPRGFAVWALSSTQHGEVLEAHRGGDGRRTGFFCNSKRAVKWKPLPCPFAFHPNDATHHFDGSAEMAGPRPVPPYGVVELSAWVNASK